MLDEQHEKDMMRNQVLAIAIVSVLFLVWYTFFIPQPPPPRPLPAQTTTANGGQPNYDGIGSDGIGSTATARPTSPGESSSWPFLPPVAVQDDPRDDEVRIGDGTLELVFTRIGGRLKEASLLLNGYGGDLVQLVPYADDTLDTETVYPLGLHFSDDAIGDALNYRRFDYELDPTGNAVTFTLEIPGFAIVRKRFSFSDREHVLRVEIDYESLEDAPRQLGMTVTPAYTLNWGPGVSTGDNGDRFPPALVWWKEDALERIPLKKLADAVDDSNYKRIPAVEWLAYRSKYFLVAFRPDFEGSDGWLYRNGEAMSLGMSVPKFKAEPGVATTRQFDLYLGPMHLSHLREAWDTLPGALRFFDSVDFMDSFAKLLLRNLNWWHGIFPSYGVAIILLTVLVRSAMLPLTIKSMRSMKKMQTLAPEMKELQEKYKDDQQELSKKTMELYRERGINPVAGCFPMLLQMPVFIALYRMLWNAFELRGTSFLWIDDLSQPDRMFHFEVLDGLPLLSYAAYFNLLPILSCLAMIVSMKVAPTTGPAQNPQQKMMMRIMPPFFAVIMYNFSAGLNLYVCTSTVLGILQQYLINAKKPAAEESIETKSAVKPVKQVVKKKKKSAQDIRKKRKQHFYTRAKERQRQQLKAAKKKQKMK